MNNVVILSTQYNRYGGAATIAYELHKYFLNNNINSIGIFFDNNAIKNKEIYNQDNLKNIYACKLLKNYLDDNINLECYTGIKKIITENTNNNFIIFGFNYLAPIIGKLLFPEKKIYYMVTGTCYINNTDITDGNSLINKTFEQKYNSFESKSIELSNYVIPNSILMKNLLSNIYNIIPNDIYDLHEIFENDIWKNLNIKNLLLEDSVDKLDYIKKYDIVFISSNFTRRVKNIEFVKKIFLHPSMEKYNKIVVGLNSNKYFDDKDIKNLVVKSCLNQEEIIKLLRQSKIILIPSFIESYSITCMEATNNNCIPLLSYNIGCNNFINNYYILSSYELDNWINKILEILNNYIYHTKIFYNNYNKGNKILNLIKNENTEIIVKKKVLFVTVDIPGIGGAATNTLNLINKFKDTWDIYSIFIDDNIDAKIKNLENYVIFKNNKNIISNLQEYKNKLTFDFDFILCKNYKCLINIKNVFKKTNIIFFPSGVRIIMTKIHKKFIFDVELEKMNNDIKYIYPDNCIDFIKINDINLDFLAFNYSDILIPNSKLTYNLIKTIYKDEKKINNPIYTTNICFDKKNISNDIFSERKFDVMFCCYSWARICKNVELVLKLIDSLSEYNILVIGKKIILNDIKKLNITYIDNIPNDEINLYYKNVKTVVIPSFFDSNPNVLIESILCGCNVVTSRNVGNSEFLNSNLVVTEHNNTDEWKNKIINSLNNRYEFNGFDGDEVKLEILKITKYIYPKYMTVGIYKINPFWDNLSSKNFEYFVYNIKKNDVFVNDIVLNDIYFIMTYKIGITNGSNDINYIIVDETIDINECYYVYNTICYYENFVKIWKIKNRNDLFYFDESDIYFLRGNYHKFYEIFIPKKSLVVFYPATSFKQNITINKIEPLVNKYSLVLIHENPKYLKLYQNNNCLLFKKFTSELFINLGINRIYDFCFVATDLQLTKNHRLFLHFLDYLEQSNLCYNIIYVGNLFKLTNNIKYCDKFTNIKLTNVNKLSRDELIILYNKSKNNLILSGRDAFPRVMTESSACGCFNIVLDTLDDGINLCDGIMGKIIGDINVKKNIVNGSLSYVPDKILFNKIIEQISIEKNHNEISIRYKKEYNIDNLIININKYLLQEKNKLMSTNLSSKIILDDNISNSGENNNKNIEYL